MDDKSQKTRLEQNIASLAAVHLREYESYIQSRDLQEGSCSMLSLLSLVSLAHIAESGMGEEARTKLLEIEAQFYSKIPWKQISENNQSAPVINTISS